ncbi:PilZ domain-containing protein [Aliiglaciecola sp. LCG003]|uniref:PilZ domain-containing protein n=1 Tax=Aliiglaciecola sp. LCG003 TaxID=3053655 RepID=UPI0025738528|nr:PilZ domain-containing protein [Aliiglaciecola sp. LCG003]WJG08429.1 PilZ domain-containing protein [Aliiglaciecola sp. LCG003]
MSQDLTEFQDIIEQLKPMINEPEFNQVLSQVASDVPKQKRFLIKMELKRLARPCLRVVDLRGQVSGVCREYTYQGKSHFLDDTAIDVFERQVRLFGEYTMGVYEAVISTENSYRVIYQKQREKAEKAEKEGHPSSEKHPHQAPALMFGNYAKRCEERMNFAINIEMFTDLNKSLQATTIDVSVSGLKIKLANEHLFKVGERITVQFRGLEGEYAIDRKAGVGYTIVDVETNKKEQRLSLQKNNEHASHAFEEFFEKFIHGNKRRYKVNMDNTLSAIKLKTYEQYFTPNFTSVPLYIETINGLHKPKYALINDSNKDPLYYWSDEQFELRIGYMINHSRLERLIALQEGPRETVLYAFNHVKDEKIYFYSASQEELFERPDLMKVFLGYGSRKASWRVFKLQITDMTLAQAHIPLSIPDSISSAVKRQNQPPAPRLMARIKNVKHIALLTDITDEVGTQTYERIPIRRSEISALRVFGHPRNKVPVAVQMFRFKYHNQRKETRYQLRSKVSLKIGDVTIEGNSEDISIHGLRVELNSFFHGVENDFVDLSFPTLQNVTKKYDLINLPYQVRGISYDRNVLHLHAVTDSANKTAQKFFDELIRNNRSKLKAYKEEEEIPGIGNALRNLYAKNVLNTAFFIRKEGVDFLPDALVTSAPNSRVNTLLAFNAEPGQFKLDFLYSTYGVELDFIQYTLKKIKTNDKPVMREIFVAFDPSQDSSSAAVKSRFADQFHGDKERKSFISEALLAGQFIAIKVFLARAGRPDLEQLQSELSYVAVYAIHRAKLLEEQLWNIVGVGDLIDVTDEVMIRHHFSHALIKNNQITPAYHKVKTTEVEHLLKT